MEWFLVKIVLGQFIMWSILFKSSTDAHTKVLDGFDFSSEDISNNIPRKPHQSKPKPQQTKPRPQQENSQEFIENILHEVGNTSPQRINRKVYNEATPTRVCYKSIIYVKDTPKGSRRPWTEQEILIDFDEEDHLELTANKNKNEILMFRIRDPDTGSNDLLNFTVIEKNRDFTISKHEKITCAFGQFLVKSYYEWPGSDRRRVVLRLSKDNDGIKYEKDELIGHDLKEQKRKVNKDESVGPKPPQHRTYDDYEVDDRDITFNEQNQIEQTNNEDSPSYSFIVSDNDNINQNQNINVVNIDTNDDKHENSVSADKSYEEDEKESDEKNNKADNFDEVIGDPHISFDSDEDSNANEIFYPDAEDNRAIDGKRHLNRTQLEELCSPILSQLLTGKKSRNGIIPGLCNLKKDEKVTIKGDVIVSKKVYNKNNKTTTEKQLYMIHENTVITPMDDQPEKPKHTKKHKKKHSEDINIDRF